MILVVNNTLGKELSVNCIIQYLKAHKYPYKVVKSIRDIDAIKTNSIHGIILSGSPIMIEECFSGHPEFFFTNIHALLVFPNVPVLGICFGCQLINVLWGGTLQKYSKVQNNSFHVDFQNTKTKNMATNFEFRCKYAPKTIPNTFRIIANTRIEGKKTPCMIQHKTAPIIGTLFHPELRPDTHWLLDTFIEHTFHFSKTNRQ
jgi:anthranilate/para-aminobenzoate synthase component II